MNDSILEHLIELRRRLLKCLAFLSVIFIILFLYANRLYDFFSYPLLTYLPEQSQIIATGIAAPLITPLKLAFYFSLLVSVPIFLYQLWAFIAPGLYKQERYIIFPLFLSSVILFYLGMAFAFFVVFPVMFQFFTSIAPKHVTMMPDMSQYLDFCMNLLFAFGFAFQVPIIIFIVVKTGWISIENLIAKRPYVIVAAFVIGMLLTPPDVVSQILLAVPICCLYEIGILIVRMSKQKKAMTTEIN